MCVCVFPQPAMYAGVVFTKQGTDVCTSYSMINDHTTLQNAIRLTNEGNTSKKREADKRAMHQHALQNSNEE